MKTLDRLKAIAVAGFVILLALNFVFVSVELIKNVKDQEIQYIPRQMWFRTAELRVTEKVMCTYFGPEIVKKIDGDENKKVRENFFNELTEYLTQKYEYRVLSVKLAENKNVCIRYIKNINKQNPKGTFLARWVP